LHPHQTTAVEWLLSHPRALLADAVGLGKTVTVCALLGRLAAADQLGRVLLVVPAALVDQWRGELARFLPSLTVADSTEQWATSSKAAAEPPAVDVLLVSYDRLNARLDTYLRSDMRVVVLDEASAVKGRGPEHQAAAQVCSGAARALALSATPMEIDATETWGLLSVVGAPNLPSEAEWGSRFVTWTDGYQPRYGPYVQPKPSGIRTDTLPELRAYLSGVSLRRTAVDVALPLPEVVEEVEFLPLTPPQETAYKAAKVVRQPLTRYHALEKACAHAEGRSAVAEAAVQRVEALPHGSKTVLYAFRLDVLDIAAGLLTAANVPWVRIDGKFKKGEQEAALRAFRDDPHVRVLLGSKVLERGLNLQQADLLLSMGTSWNPAAEAQRVGRLRRIGSPHAQVRHVSLLTDTPHDRPKWAKVAQRGEDNLRVIG
jgi:SNF2 family DNA or RNA helicase